MYILFLVHPIFGASYLWGSLPSYVVPYISVSYFCTSYFWFFLSLRFPFLTLWFLISVDPMFGVSYFCVPIFVSSYLYVTLKMGKRPSDEVNLSHAQNISLLKCEKKENDLLNLICSDEEPLAWLSTLPAWATTSHLYRRVPGIIGQVPYLGPQLKQVPFLWKTIGD